ncbi:hypothetical protein DXG03_008875 [Asterophora parasitica]|uniref:Uncharacterized protein n=1 Tax=Asterophora parasitica TaxID=117018 RepID=A0A9P7GBJ6_9AGAR|nr:hypothetical protein DXG03_008875 [Asterophora parasitica]
MAPTSHSTTGFEGVRDAPKLRVFFEPPDVRRDENATVIFLVRWVPFEDDSQLDSSCEENRTLWTPNETDRAKFDAFKTYFEGGRLPDLDHCGFSCIKDIHPALDDRD